MRSGWPQHPTSRPGGQASPMRLFYEQVVTAAGANLELVRAPDEALPPDLQITGTLSRHLLGSLLELTSLAACRAPPRLSASTSPSPSARVICVSSVTYARPEDKGKEARCQIR